MIGEDTAAIWGPTESIPKIPSRTKKLCFESIPKSACLKTMTASSTTTPAILFSGPNRAVNAEIKATQNAMVKNTFRI